MYSLAMLCNLGPLKDSITARVTTVCISKFRTTGMSWMIDNETIY
jgi:hypothetical protein